ncbi:CBS domain containing membrane protein [Solidesulfovibrio fructosivorans JJ]]|uniref:CBS domain containing membrane protein n=1 Tax=Solidesulfovibrio fructosivorans JJ] TaxID=596151 RepID=E1JWD5_SOLFR|nr:CBS domain-containing protein [Solidesulfovibrio fructosivorans]EFL51232.1 CBS domain containing membrane protein [Solidesulfovibrio fructosivorans JJ]]
MLKAKDMMTSDVVTITEDTEISAAAKLLLEKGFNGMPVLNAAGKLTGILCQADLVAQQKKLSLPSVFSLLDGFIPLGSMKDLDREVEKMSALTAVHAMSRNPATVSPETGIDEVASLMTDKGYHTIPVTDAQGKVVGIIGMSDVLGTLVDKK